MSNSPPDKKLFRKALITSISGQALEWADFNLYGLAAAVVFPKIFFPATTPLIGTLASFATFAVGFIGRPIGGLVFGRLGDRIGRAPTLVMTLLLMGLSTVCIGLLPTYDTIGVLAPLLLVVLRIAQGIGVGGEWSGASILVLEYAPQRRRGYYTAMINSGEYIGVLFATLLFTTLYAGLSEQEFVSWGWRIPFLVMFMGVVFGLVVRQTVDETPVFREIAEEVAKHRVSLRAALRSQGRAVIQVIGIKVFENASAYLLMAFSVTYASLIGGISSDITTLGICLASVITIPMIPLWGYVSDHVGRKPVFIGGVLFLVAFFWPFFELIGTRETAWIWLAFIVSHALGIAPMLSVEPSWFAEMFPAEFRFSGTGISTSIAAVLSGGLAPFIATALFAAGGNSVGLILVYVGALASISLTACIFASETRGKNVLAHGLLPDAIAPAQQAVTV